MEFISLQMIKIKLLRNKGTLEIDCILKAHAAGSRLCTIAVKKNDQDKWKEIGDISFHKKAKSHVFIEDVCIEREYRSQGFGRLLIEKLQSKYQRISLFSTVSAEAFWLKMGFVEDPNTNTQDQIKLTWSKTE